MKVPMNFSTGFEWSKPVEGTWHGTIELPSGSKLIGSVQWVDMRGDKFWSWRICLHTDRGILLLSYASQEEQAMEATLVRNEMDRIACGYATQMLTQMELALVGGSLQEYYERCLTVSGATKANWWMTQVGFELNATVKRA